MAIAKAIVLQYDPSGLKENGGYIDIGRNWALTLLERMKFVNRKGTTAKCKQSIADFMERKQEFLQDIVTTVRMEDIPAELILNWDQTGIKLVPSSSRTLALSGSKCVEMKGANDKCQVTAVFCGNMLGVFLPLQVIYQGKTSRCHSSHTFPPDWNITHSPKHCSTEEMMVWYIENIVYTYVESTRQQLGYDCPALMITDNFKGQVTTTVNELLVFHNIQTCLLPPNTTNCLQPLDIAVNNLLKIFLGRSLMSVYSTSDAAVGWKK